jgi:epithelial splicing regulatory protein 1/2
VTAGAKKTTEVTQGSYKHDSESGIALKLRGLPYSVTADDIKGFFLGYNIQSDSVKIGL